MFPDLSGLEFEGDTVTVRLARPQRRVQVDRELLLVPSVLGSPNVFTVVDAPWPLSVYYPARAAAEIREPQCAADDWLATLAGRTRARVLRSVSQPATTTQIAARLRIAPASVSQHLQRLHRGGLIRRTRRGVRVVYTLSETGRRLLALEATA